VSGFLTKVKLTKLLYEKKEYQEPVSICSIIAKQHPRLKLNNYSNNF
jgi:hypothetical protein